MLLHADTPPQQPPCPLTRGCAFMNDDQIGDWGDVVEGGRSRKQNGMQLDDRTGVGVMAHVVGSGRKEW